MYAGSLSPKHAEGQFPGEAALPATSGHSRDTEPWKNAPVTWG